MSTREQLNPVQRAYLKWTDRIDRHILRRLAVNARPAISRDLSKTLSEIYSEDTGNLEALLGLSLNPNPPKDTDGRREGSGRGWVRELQGRWPGVLG